MCFQHNSVCKQMSVTLILFSMVHIAYIYIYKFISSTHSLLFILKPPLHLDISKSGPEKFEVIRRRTLQCSTHPLLQKMLKTKLLLHKNFNDVLEDYEKDKALIPDFISENGSINCDATVGKREEFCCRLEDVNYSDLRKSVEVSAQIIRNFIDSSVQILQFIYGKEQDEVVSSMLSQSMENLILHDLWKKIIIVARLSNMQMEIKINEVMLACKHCSPQEFGVSEDNVWLFTEPRDICDHAVASLKQMPSVSTLDKKISLLTQVQKSLCENERNEKNSPRGVLGADALLPILSYVLLQCGMPQLVTELQVLELFIHPMYILSAEGFVLTSFLTAFKYLELKKDS